MSVVHRSYTDESLMQVEKSGFLGIDSAGVFYPQNQRNDMYMSCLLLLKYLYHFSRTWIPG